MFICWGKETPPPFVMTQINEIKRNTLPNFIYAFPMSTANLHSSLAKAVLPSTIAVGCGCF